MEPTIHPEPRRSYGRQADGSLQRIDGRTVAGIVASLLGCGERGRRIRPTMTISATQQRFARQVRRMSQACSTFLSCPLPVAAKNKSPLFRNTQSSSRRKRGRIAYERIDHQDAVEIQISL